MLLKSSLFLNSSNQLYIQLASQHLCMPVMVAQYKQLLIKPSACRWTWLWWLGKSTVSFLSNACSTYCPKCILHLLFTSIKKDGRMHNFFCTRIGCNLDIPWYFCTFSMSLCTSALEVVAISISFSHWFPLAWAGVHPSVGGSSSSLPRQWMSWASRMTKKMFSNFCYSFCW